MRSGQQLQHHARALARAFNVDFVEVPMVPEAAFSGITRDGRRIARCAPVVDETTYAVALHEIGHMVAPLGAVREFVTGDVRNLKLAEEEAAWVWAKHYALVWTAPMAAVVTWSFDTYRHAPRSSTPPVVPPAPRKPINWDDWK